METVAGVFFVYCFNCTFLAIKCRSRGVCVCVCVFVCLSVCVQSVCGTLLVSLWWLWVVCGVCDCQMDKRSGLRLCHFGTARRRRWWGLRRRWIYIYITFTFTWRMLWVFKTNQEHDLYSLTCLMKEGLHAVLQTSNNTTVPVSKPIDCTTIYTLFQLSHRIQFYTIGTYGIDPPLRKWLYIQYLHCI